MIVLACRGNRRAEEFAQPMVSLHAAQQIFCLLHLDKHSLISTTNSNIDGITDSVTDSVTNSVTDSVGHSITDSITDNVTEGVLDSVTDSVT